MGRLLEHPEVARALRTGYPRPMPPAPICPVCGAECEWVFKTWQGEIAGCDECLEKCLADQEDL